MAYCYEFVTKLAPTTQYFASSSVIGKIIQNPPCCFLGKTNNNQLDELYLPWICRGLTCDAARQLK